MPAKTKAAHSVRPLKSDDLTRVVEIDHAHTGQARRRFFERRLEAAKAHPEDFIYVGVSEGKTLVGFAFARLLYGEFGREEAVAEFDAIGVDPAAKEHGVGHALIEGLINVMRHKGVRAFQSEADWTRHDLLRFFESNGFKLAPRMVLERPVNVPLQEPGEIV